MNFLIVDDSREDVALLRSALHPGEQVEITPIENGSTALQLLADRQCLPYDLVVIDWRMPGVSGEELAKAFLNSTALRPRIPVVVLSSALPPAVASSLHEDGVLVFEKPSDFDGYERLAAGLCQLAKRPHVGASVAV